MTTRTDKTIQGLYSWDGAEGYYWLLRAQIELAQFIREKVYKRKGEETS